MSPTSEHTGAWLTQEAYDRLSAELEHLSGPARTEVVARIEAAREEGDLKENGGYHAAKDEQGKIEARIRELTQLLETATVGHAPKDDGVVEPGMVVTAKVANKEMTFLFGNREIAGDSDLTVYSEKSPIGSAIQGHKEGDKLSYEAPNGKDIAVEIVKVTPFKG
ncbi:transcription elongation factor GreA [Micrococcoides hystricis]|uniref:Transcription elongation factor GreA n=1 Tax=Micrococcoides hystricis TaxID=1572761 RepID=A0ABV6PA71_9MICC